MSLRMTLLDKQLVDADRLPIGRIDDMEIELPAEGGRPRVTALLTGAQALGERLGSGLGRRLAGSARRLRGPGGDDRPARVEPGTVRRLEPFVELGVSFADLGDVAGLERWLAQRVERVPGAGRAHE